MATGLTGARSAKDRAPVLSLSATAGGAVSSGGLGQTTPWAIIALATLRKPAMLAPAT